MKIVISRPKFNSSEKLDAFNKETALVLMKYLKIKREPVITLFTEINKECPKTFRARKKLLQLVDWYGENNESMMMQINKARSVFTISPIKDTKASEEEKCQIISIEYIKRNGYINVQKINSTTLPLEIRLKLKPRPVGIRKKKEKSAISNVDGMIIDVLREHQNIYLRDYAEIINILNKKTTLNKSPSTNLRRIHNFIDIKKDKSAPKKSPGITEIIISIRNKQSYYYLISNGKNQYLIQEKVMARQLHFNGTFDWMLVINKIQMAFTEATGYLNQEFGLTLEKNNSGYREAIINAIKNDNTFLRKNKRKWREACNIIVLWENHNSKEADIIHLNSEVITTKINASQENKKARDTRRLAPIKKNKIQNSKIIKMSNNNLKQRIENIIHNT